MPTWMPADTSVALGPNAEKCDSRSLLLDRFVDPAAREKERQAVFTRAMAKHPDGRKAALWARLLQDGLGLDACALLYAQLQSRLMVNMAGGVMENAGLCLDRFGMPSIPGSAVKGCARRAALAALREWCETGQKPGATEQDKENLFTAACESFSEPSALLAAIARVFGWCEQDWKTRADFRDDQHWLKNRSDFAWACSGASDPAASPGRDTTAQGNAQGSSPRKTPSPEEAAPSWPAIRDLVVCRLARELRVSIPGDEPQPAKRLPNFAGSVAFLPAYLVDLGKPSAVDGLAVPVPELGKLELDVVTVHHKKYYAGPESPNDPASVRAWQREWGTAPDIEEPVPNVFPAVAAGHVFAFAVRKLRNGEDTDLSSARIWLAIGLQTFGLGAKTAAGYGWFDVARSVQQCVGSAIRQAAEARHAKQAEEEEAQRKAAAREAAAKAEQERLAKAAPQERFQAEYANLNDEPFAAQAKKCAEMSEEQRHGFILVLKNQKRETTKRWAKKKPDLLKPWQDHAQKLQPPIQLP